VRWVAVSLLLSADPASAEQDAPFELNWSAPRSCPSAASIQAQISELAPTPRPRAARLSVEATVHEQVQGFVLDLVLRDGELVGRRRFEGDSCEEVAGAAAVTIALLLSSADGESLDRAASGGTAPGSAVDTPSRDAAERAPSVGAAQRQSPARDRAVPGSARREAGRRWHWLISAPTLSAGVGMLSEASVGLGGGLGVEFGAWRFALSGTYGFDRELESAEVPDVAVEIGRWVARLEACRWLGHSRLQIAPCATLALQYLAARGGGSDVSSSDTAFTWAALGPRLTSRWRLTDPVALSAAAGLELQTARPSLVIDGLGEIERIGAVELVLQAGAEWIF